jgi:hypothetical protein
MHEVIRYGWRAQLELAHTEEAVVDLARQYLDEWSDDEVATIRGLPWPITLSRPGDLTRCIRVLSRCHARFRGDSQGLARLQELLLFFTCSSTRAVQLSRQQHRARGGSVASPFRAARAPWV